MVIFIPRSLTPRFLLTRFKSFQNAIARGTVPLLSLPLRPLLSQLPPPHFPLPLLPRRPLPAGLSCHQGSEAALQPGQPHLSTLQGGKWASGTAGYAGAHRNEAWELLPAPPPQPCCGCDLGSPDQGGYSAHLVPALPADCTPSPARPCSLPADCTPSPARPCSLAS